jgi:cyclohexadienyl dehydratase
MRPRPLVLVIAVLAVALNAYGQQGDTLRIGTSGDYPPFSVQYGEEPRVYEGLDIALARAYAEERGLTPVMVPFRWPELLRNLEAGRFDLAMSGVTVVPDRSIAGRFSVPVVQTGAVVLVRQPERFEELEDLNRSIVRIGVNAGGYLQRVANARFRRATVVAIPDNFAVIDALVAENVHAVVTDNVEASVWGDAVAGLKLLGPFTRDRKAFLIHPDRAALAADLDRWLLGREADGSLAALRHRYLGANAGPTVAEPLVALLTAVDERLALMPTVGVAKRREGIPLVAERRETVVIDAGVEATRAAAAASKREAPTEALVRSFFRAQIEAAKEVQLGAIQDRDFERPDEVPSVNGALRPALLRIGQKIARLLLALPADLDRADVRAAAREELRTAYLSDASRLAIADAIANLAAAPRAQ